MCSRSSKGSSGTEKRDTEDCGSRPPNWICCSRWRTWFWLTGIACRSESVRLAWTETGAFCPFCHRSVTQNSISAVARCCLNAKNVKALSWTLDRSIAEWFATRFDEDGTVYQAQIDKSHIYAYFDGRNESEVIVDPKYLMDITESESMDNSFDISM